MFFDEVVREHGPLVRRIARAFLTTEPALEGYVAIGGVQLMLAAWLALGFRRYQAVHSRGSTR